MKDPNKLEWKRHTPETSNWKATHCENNLKATHAKQTNLKTLEIQLESALCYENNSKATHCDI